MITKPNARNNKALYAFMLLGLTLLLCSTSGLPAVRAEEVGTETPAVTTVSTPIETGTDTRPLTGANNQCLTHLVFITLNSEQFSFCAPTNLPSNVVEDNITNPNVTYAQLNQITGYGVTRIQVVAPGNIPGSGMPVYNSGKIAGYRQAILDIESSKSDRTVSTGPVGIFWTETVPSIQIDTTLGAMNIRSFEWFVEHHDRLWVFVTTWDTGLENQNEWIAASNNFSIREPDISNLLDTAIDLGASFLKSQSSQPILASGGVVDVGIPSWWIGTCDDNHYFPYTGTHSFPLGSSWHGVITCGPRPYYSNTEYPVVFYSGAHPELEFQCVELVMRFLYQEWGIIPWVGDGNQIKNNYDSSLMVFYSNGANSIVPGDILTENGTSGGHAAIITSVNLDSNGTGTINILEQNASAGGSRSLHVTNWNVDPDPGLYSQTIQGWLHAKANNSGNCPGPSLNSPSDGYVSTSQTISFSWSAPSGCTFSGYTFRIKDTSNMESGGNTIVDTGEGNTSHTETIGANWNNTDLYWGVRTANPLSPNWSVRRFRIQPGSPPSTPSNPNPSDNATVSRTNDTTFSWNTDGTSCDIHIWGGPGIDTTQTGISCSNFHWGSQWPGTYQWQVTAHNSHGTTGGPTWHLNIRPYAPTGLNASPASQTQINLSWTKSGDDPGSVDSYNVYHSDGSWITNIGAGSASYQVGGLTCNTSYSFYITAVRQSVESTSSNIASATTSSCGQAPSAPSLSSPGDGSSNPYNYDLTFQWNVVSDANEYLIEWWGGPYSTMQPCGWSNSISCHIGTVIAGNTYSWHVKARNGFGESNWSDTWTFTIQPQPASDITLTGVWTADGNWTQKSSYNPGDPIQWIIEVNNTTSANVTVQLVFDVRGPLGQSVANWSGSVDVQPGDWLWGLPGTVPSLMGGTYLFTGGVIYEGVTYQATTSYNVSGPAQIFDDVPPSYWAFAYINALYTAGITGGCGTAPLIYCPNTSVTRAQMAIFLERGMNGSTYTPPAATGTVFSDVPNSYWAAAWIEKLDADGITSGCGGGNFCPNQAVTRAQVAIFLLRAEHGSSYTPPVAIGTVFGDVPISYWDAAWIEQLYAEGITGGCGGGDYCPANSVTRAQMAVFLVRTFNLP